MKPEYDFSNGQRGKFYQAGAVFKLPVYLDEEVQSYLAAKALSKGVELSDLVNELLKKEIEMIENPEAAPVNGHTSTSFRCSSRSAPDS